MPDTIEAEVLEIDGAPVPRPADPAEQSRSADPWSSMRGRVLRLDRRWWPLWVLLGIVAAGIVLVVGIVAAVVLTVVKVTAGVLRFLTGWGSSKGDSALSRRSF